MTPIIFKELQEQIEREAEGYSREQEADYSRRSVNAYIAGATAYAHYKERFDQAKNALEEIAALRFPSDIAYRANSIAKKAIASWKEEGKDASAPVDGPRGSGYYKVRLHGNWIIAEYFNYVEGGNHWYVCGNETSFADQDFQQIGERLL